MGSADIERHRSNWQSEIDGAAIYRAMAEVERSAPLARVYTSLAEIEERHARFWEERLEQAGYAPQGRAPSWRARFLIWVARRWGASSILHSVAAGEYRGRNDYLGQHETSGTAMTREERMHARVLHSVLTGARGVEGPTFARLEGRHRSVRGNVLRAAVLGANDGLCSNLALVMGVAGAALGGEAVLVAGIAGLLAGAFSMGLGEWISVTSARELAERELRIERAELEAHPEEERQELQLIYEAKGLAPAEARELSARLSADPSVGLEVLAREELGIDPRELAGSASAAAASSMALFAAGAMIPVLPYLLFTGSFALLASLGVSALGLFALGAAISVLTGRSLIRSGARQLLLGLAAAAVTHGIGRIIGVTALS